MLNTNSYGKIRQIWRKVFPHIINAGIILWYIGIITHRCTECKGKDRAVLIKGLYVRAMFCSFVTKRTNTLCRRIVRRRTTLFFCHVATMNL